MNNIRIRVLILAAIIISVFAVSAVKVIADSDEGRGFATKEHVQESVNRFKQSIIGPIIVAIVRLKGDVNQLDGRVAELEEGAKSKQVTTDRAINHRLTQDALSTPVQIVELVDTNDGHVIETFLSEGAGKVEVVQINCTGTRAILRDFGTLKFLLFDTSDGKTLGKYEGPSGAGLGRHIFSCANLTQLNTGLNVVKNRAALSWAFGDCDESACLTLLIDTDTGSVVSSYNERLDGPDFDCTGSRFVIQSVGIVDSITGAVIVPGAGSIGVDRVRFSC